MTPDDHEQILTFVDGMERCLRTEIQAVKSETIEAIRDMQTEILKGIERFARGNYARFVHLETSDSATAERLAALEERVLALETRRPPQ